MVLFGRRLPLIGVRYVLEVIRLSSSCCAGSSAQSHTFSARAKEACRARTHSTAHTRRSALVLEVNSSFSRAGNITLQCREGE
jgi:hypothetical protein